MEQQHAITCQRRQRQHHHHHLHLSWRILLGNNIHRTTLLLLLLAVHVNPLIGSCCSKLPSQTVRAKYTKQFEIDSLVYWQDEMMSDGDCVCVCLFVLYYMKVYATSGRHQWLTRQMECWFGLTLCRAQFPSPSHTLLFCRSDVDLWAISGQCKCHFATEHDCPVHVLSMVCLMIVLLINIYVTTIYSYEEKRNNQINVQQEKDKKYHL